jgi:hypothetical protein
MRKGHRTTRMKVTTKFSSELPFLGWRINLGVHKKILVSGHLEFVNVARVAGRLLGLRPSNTRCPRNAHRSWTVA